jgi:hypothetical protein
MTIRDDQHHSQPLRPEDLSVPGHEIRVISATEYGCSCGLKLSEEQVGIHISQIARLRGN